MWSSDVRRKRPHPSIERSAADDAAASVAVDAAAAAADTDDYDDDDYDDDDEVLDRTDVLVELPIQSAFNRRLSAAFLLARSDGWI